MMIIYLNFLIAIISDSYANVITKKVIVLYGARAEVNFEITLMFEFLQKYLFTLPHASTFSLLCTYDESSDDRLADKIVGSI